MQTGYKYAWKYGYDMAVQVDGDGQHDPEFLNEMAEFIDKNKVDMVIGSSAGALIGGFYAAGYRPEEIEEIALEMDWPELFSDESRNLYETYSKTTRNDRYFLDLGVSRNFKMEIGSSILSGQRILNLFKEKKR